MNGLEFPFPARGCVSLGRHIPRLTFLQILSHVCLIVIQEALHFIFFACSFEYETYIRQGVSKRNLRQKFSLLPFSIYKMLFIEHLFYIILYVSSS